VATLSPPIFFIFLCLSILEDSGYMARAAFVMDRLLRAVGLPGKAFVPMLVGFGCNVPAIMATRTLDNERDRILTILINPFMSCGARLPVYILFAAVFFPQRGSALVFALYVVGIVLGILSGFLFKRTLFRGEIGAFVMELPTYHVPTVRGICHHTWNKLKSFVSRAGRVIIVVVVVMSLLNALGTDGSFDARGSERSLLSAIGKRLTPLFRPMGIGDDNWPAVVGLFSGIFAKEAVIGALDALYSRLEAREEAGAGRQEEPFDPARRLGEAFAAVPRGFRALGPSLVDPLGLREAGGGSDAGRDFAGREHVARVTVRAMRGRFDGKIGAVAYLLFVLLYAPCIAAIAAIYHETGLRWAVFAVVYLTGVAWIVATVFYQVGTFGRHPAASLAWVAAAAAVVVAFVAGLRLTSRRMGGCA
jgi:ferrous iron transport protein B